MRSVTTCAVGAIADQYTTDGGNDDSIGLGRSGVPWDPCVTVVPSKNGVPWEPCVTLVSSSMYAPSGTGSGHTMVPPTQAMHDSGTDNSDVDYGTYEDGRKCITVGTTVTMEQQIRGRADLPTGILGRNPRGFNPCGIGAKKGNKEQQGLRAGGGHRLEGRDSRRSRSSSPRHGAGRDAIVGAVCITSLLAPGPPVIAPARRWGDDAPPGGQPDMEDRTKVSEHCTRSRSSDGTGMKLQVAIAEDDVHDGVDDALHDKVISKGTSIHVKCKGKYRITVKGPARHGCGCCGGT